MPADTSPTIAEVQRAQAQAVGGKKDKCVKGKSCSATCIDPNETCLVEFPTPISNSLTKAASSLAPNEIATIEKLRDDFKERKYRDIRYAMQVGGYQAYNRARDEIIEFNKNLKEGEASNIEPIKVPVTWEKARKIQKAYLKATDKAIERAETAGYKGDRKAFDAEIKKLDQMYNLVGSRLGEQKESKYIKWDDFQADTLVKRLHGVDFGKGTKISYNGGSDLSIFTKVGKNVVEVNLADGGTTFTFLVNGSYGADPSISSRDKLAIAMKVKDVFSKVVRNFDDGSVITVRPYEADGKGEGRRKAYRAFGFQGNDDDLYGKVSKGKIIGATPDEFDNYYDRGEFNFAEKLDRQTAIMYRILWGEPYKP